MSTTRKIGQVLKSKPTLEGAGVHLKRVFGYPHAPRFDPFLLLDDFHSSNPDDYINGFPWHPHRGIETITYMLQGKVEHGDSMGNNGVIGSGDVQWMTAGSGIIHQEMPKGRADGTMWGFQLWANLPASHKMMEPRYRDIQQHQIPEVKLDSGATVKIVCGEVNGIKGPAQDIIIAPEFLDVMLPPNTSFTHHTSKGNTVFTYVISGAGYFEPKQDPFGYEIEGQNYFDFKRESLIGIESLVAFEDGDELAISAGNQGLRFLLIAGQPIREPIAWYGPIVMNTREELRIAFDEYQQGTFLKHAQ